MRVGGQRHAPAALPPGMTRYPLYRRLGRPQARSGRMLKISPPPGFDPRTVQIVAIPSTLSRPRILPSSPPNGLQIWCRFFVPNVVSNNPSKSQALYNILWHCYFRVRNCSALPKPLSAVLDCLLSILAAALRIRRSLSTAIWGRDKVHS
jgi:hypothetical protein